MSPEELEFQKKLSGEVLELKAMFKRFTTEKQQRYKDEQARRRERRWYPVVCNGISTYLYNSMDAYVYRRIISWNQEE